MRQVGGNMSNKMATKRQLGGNMGHLEAKKAGKKAKVSIPFESDCKKKVSIIAERCMKKCLQKPKSDHSVREGSK